MDQEPILNEHNKQEYPPMHTDGTDTSLIIKRVVLCIVLVMMAYSVFAQQRMCPIPKANLKENKFDKRLSLGFGIDTAYKFVYLVEPSFTTEYCLTYDSINQSLLLCKSKSKIGYAIYGMAKAKKQERKDCQPIGFLSTKHLPIHCSRCLLQLSILQVLIQEGRDLMAQVICFICHRTYIPSRMLGHLMRNPTAVGLLD